LRAVLALRWRNSRQRRTLRRSRPQSASRRVTAFLCACWRDPPNRHAARRLCDLSSDAPSVCTDDLACHRNSRMALPSVSETRSPRKGAPKSKRDAKQERKCVISFASCIPFMSAHSCQHVSTTSRVGARNNLRAALLPRPCLKHGESCDDLGGYRNQLG